MTVTCTGQGRMRSRSIEFALQNYSADVIEVDSNRIREYALNPVCSADAALETLLWDKYIVLKTLRNDNLHTSHVCMYVCLQ